MDIINKISMPFLLVCFFFFFIIFSVESKGSNRLAPALYVFGDATVDAGNNEKLNTKAKANFPPYGIDLPGGAKASGRFTNGRTIVDFYAEWLGLKSPPPFLKVNLTGAKILSGFNYASGSSGILEETGKKFGENLSLGKQVMLFKQTVEGYLTTLLKNRGGIGRLRKHLSKSIFLIVSGSSDFNLNLLPPYENKSWSDTPDEFTPFTSLLANTIEQYLKDLYKLGARKMVVYDAGPTAIYGHTINTPIDIYNEKLHSRLYDMRSTLNGSTIILAKHWDMLSGLEGNPTTFGFNDTNPCCKVSAGQGLMDCIPNTVACTNRNAHVKFDRVNPSEAAHMIMADNCFNKVDFCQPMNIRELATVGGTRLAPTQA